VTETMSVVVNFFYLFAIGFLLLENWLIEGRLADIEDFLEEIATFSGDDGPGEPAPKPKPLPLEQPAPRALKIVGKP
jgi:hypothetical protein